MNKQKLKSLIELADKYNITYEKPIKKQDLLFLINNYISTNCFEYISQINASKTDLVTIGRNIQSSFDELFSTYMSSIDTVIIENQISPIANRMKTIQGMIAQYFIMKNNNISIEFVSASNKLKIEGDPKETKETKESTTYKERKTKGVELCKKMMNDNVNYQEWKVFFNNHKKKDDLADSLLQGLYYISNCSEK
jgi:hypothetical protein